MNETDIVEKLNNWMREFVEVPNPKLGDWAPCPYARQARISNKIKIIFSEIDYLSKIVKNSTDFLDVMEVVVICFDHKLVNPVILQEWVESMNNDLMKDNFVVLEDHPDSPEYINGVKMNFGECGLLIVQKLDKLNNASDQLKAKGYYSVWNQQDLDSVVSWRYK
jgi:hypothetical protein